MTAASTSFSQRIIPAQPAGELAERLGSVRYVFTDLDGTMLAPGSTVMRDSQGRPSAALPAVLADLAAAGVEVVPVSGRNRAMLHEDCRVLGLNSYIGEMGGLIMYNLREQDWEYFCAEMPYDPACGLTPHEVVERSGACQEIIDRWQPAGLIEYQNDMGTGYKHREVTVGYRGNVPDAEVRALLDVHGLALDWVDNGYLTHVSKPTLLAEDGGPWRAFMIVPRGLDKGAALARYMERRGIKPEEAIALGDSPADFDMAPQVGLFVCMENGLKHPAAAALAEGCDNLLVSDGPTVDGWVAAMRSVLACKRTA